MFLGIPYAAPPFGSLRLAAPAPVPAWAGVRSCDSYGPTAPQPHRQFTLVPEPVMDGDDCLNLNVFAPADAAGADLPVLVWIHGGGFTAGCNASPWYTGHRFARDGVVLVSINYRLGAEGFMAVEGAPLNRGLLDWLAALRWVQENIAAFGGDPAKVTIAGQSAGGIACAALLTCPAADGLFRSAVCMSGSRMAWPSVGGAQRIAELVAAELGVPASADALRSVEPARLVAAQDAAAAAAARERGSDSIRLAFGPVADDEHVPSAPYDVVRAGSRAAVPLMLGATAEEFNATFAAVPGGVDWARLERRLGRMGLSDPAAVAAAYRAAMPDAEPAQILGQAVTDSTFKAPAVKLADLWAGAGGAAYLYDFEWRSPVGNLGAVHCLDIPFAFDNLDASGVPEVAGAAPPQDLADAIHSAWVRFVTSGDPGWTRYDPATRPAMVFDETSKVVDDPWRLARTTFAS